MTVLRFVSFFDGVGMFDLAMQLAGHVNVGACEIDPFARKVRAARLGAPAWYPSDIREVRADDIPDADLWIGGSPCQSFSVAGERAGLSGSSGLLLTWLDLLTEKKPRWFMLENVPGMLTGSDGDDDADDTEGSERGNAGGAGRRAVDESATRPASWMAIVLGKLADCGYEFAWRTLDAKFFGVPQRRRRVFLVAGRAGERPSPAEILFESESGERNPAARETKGPRLASTTSGGVGGGGKTAGCRPGASRRGPPDVAGTLQGSQLRKPNVDGADQGHLISVPPPMAFNHQAGGSRDHLNWSPIVSSLSVGQTPAVAIPAIGGSFDDAAFQCHGSNVGPMGTLRAGNGNETGGVPFMAVDLQNTRLSGDVSPTLDTSRPTRGGGAAVMQVLAPSYGVRRLTPLECERLQGLPDGWTCLCTAAGNTSTCECADGPRYRVIGNGGAVPVVLWIARRLATLSQPNLFTTPEAA